MNILVATSSYNSQIFIEYLITEDLWQKAIVPELEIQTPLYLLGTEYSMEFTFASCLADLSTFANVYLGTCIPGQMMVTHVIGQ